MDTEIMVPGEVKQEVNTLQQWAKTVKVTTVQERDAAMTVIKNVKVQRIKIVEFFKASKEAAHTAWKAIVANEKSFTDTLDMVERAGKSAVMSYELEEQRKADEARRKLQAEADAAAERERKRLMAEAAKLKTPELKEQRMEQAAAVVAPVVQVAAPVVAAGSSIVKTWKAKVVDLSIVPMEYHLPNQQALDAVAKATKGAIKIAGVEFYEESSMRVSTR